MSKLYSSGTRRSARISIALIAALVLLFAFSVAAFAADHVVGGTCATGTSQASIQAAVNAAAAGDTINVCDGAYLEDVNVTKSVVLIGESNTGTTVNGSFNVNAQAVTIEGFNIVGTVNGIYVTSGSGHVFRNNVITGPGTVGAARGIHTQTGNSIHGLVIQNNTISNWSSCIYFNPSRHNLVLGNTFGACAAGIGTDNLIDSTIAYNTFNGPFSAEGIGAGPTGNGIYVTGNNFASGSGTPIRNYSASPVINTEENYYGGGAPVGSVTSAVSLSSAPVTHVVNDDASACIFGTSTFSSVQAAVSAANSGDTIAVCDGSYVETLNLGAKSLWIHGESEAGTVLATTPSASYGLQGTGRVAVSDLTIVGPHNGSGYGIKIDSATATVALSGVSVINSGRSNVDANGSSLALLSHVTATDSKWGFGVGLSDVRSSGLSNIVTSNNAWGGVAVMTKRQWVPTPVERVGLYGSIDLDEVVELQVEMNVNSGVYYSVPNISLNGTMSHVIASDGGSSTNVFLFSSSQGKADAVHEASRIKYGAASGPWALQGGMVHVVGNASTISSAITAASAGDTILVGEGTFAEKLDITKHLQIIGIGNGAASASNTIVDPVSGQVVSIEASGVSAANPLLIANLRLMMEDNLGITFFDQGISGPTTHLGTVKFIELNSVNIIGSYDTVIGSGENEFGISVPYSVNVTDFKMVKSAIEGTDIGIYTQQTPPVVCGSLVAPYSTFSGVTIEDSVFNRNNAKGLYFEKIGNATFTDVLVSNNGYVAAGAGNGHFNAGFDINVKYGTYGTVTLNDVYVLQNGLGFQEGMGLGIKHRADSSSYNTCPAQLGTVTINGGAIIGNERGIRVGEPKGQSSGAQNTAPAVIINGTTIYNNKALFAVAPTLPQPTNAAPLFSQSVTGDVINWGLNSVTVNASYLGEVSPVEAAAVLAKATESSMPVASGTVADPLESFSINFPATTLLRNGAPATGGTILVPVELDGYATDIATFNSIVTHNACLVPGSPLFEPVQSAYQWDSANINSTSSTLNFVGFNGAGVQTQEYKFPRGGVLGYLKFDASACPAGVLNFGFSSGSCGTNGGFGDNHCTFSGGAVTLDLNVAPTNLAIDDGLTWTTSPNAVFSQGEPPLTVVGTLSTVDGNDPNTGFARIYSLEIGGSCSAAVAAHHELFTISENELLAVRTFSDSETGPFHLCVRANDQRSGNVYADITVTLRDKPDSLSPDTMTVAENATADTPIGTITSNTDVDGDDEPFIYTIQSVSPSVNFFKIGGANNDQILVDNTPLVVGTYDVLVRSRGANDPVILFHQEVIQIQVLNSAEVYVAVNGTTQNAVRRGNSIVIPFAYRPGAEAATELNFQVNYDQSCLQFNSGASSLSGGTVNGGSGQITFDLDHTSSIGAVNVATVNFTALSGCGGHPLYHESLLGFVPASMSIGVSPSPVVHPTNVVGLQGKVFIIDDSARGDCNWSGAVNAADLSATVLEIFDTGFLDDNTGTAPAGFLTAPKSNFVGSPYGCDSNGTGSVAAGDISCTSLIIFNGPSYVCEPPEDVQPADVSAAILGITKASAEAGKPVVVPLTLASNGHAVSSLTFKLQIDPAQLAFDPSDVNGDGLPDALVLDIPAPFMKLAQWNAENNTLQIAVFAFANPLPVLSDGQFGSVTFRGLQNAESVVSILEASAGNATGQDIKLDISIGGVVTTNSFSFLPLIQ